jgi:hypothetical protein
MMTTTNSIYTQQMISMNGQSNMNVLEQTNTSGFNGFNANTNENRIQEEILH